MFLLTPLTVRDARDRLIDLLGFGRTYPLADLVVQDEQLTVAFNTIAKIPIDDSQKGVMYQLRFKGQPVERTASGEKGPGVTIEGEGHGGTLVLETYKIQEDTEFQIFAKKQSSGLATYLIQEATVKVGLDVRLAASILKASYLDPNLTGPTDARLIAYGQSVKVQLENSQEGVVYQLVSLDGAKKEVTLSTEPMTGNLKAIELTTQVVFEDVDIRIRATKTFDPSEKRQTETRLLDVVLPLKVRPNQGVAVRAADSIVDFKQPATIKIAKTQKNVTYTLYARSIPESDFVRALVAAAAVVKVGVTGEPDVQVSVPPLELEWRTPEGYVKVGEAKQGTGGEVTLSSEILVDDTLFIVQAKKEHLAPQINSSAVPVTQVAAVLVRPDPGPEVSAKKPSVAPDTVGMVLVDGTQRGVVYQLRVDANNKAVNPPGFHYEDRGVETTRIEVDFIVEPPSDLSAKQRLLLLPTESLTKTMIFNILATKVLTRVSTTLNAKATIEVQGEPGARSRELRQPVPMPPVKPSSKGQAKQSRKARANPKRKAQANSTRKTAAARSTGHRRAQPANTAPTTSVGKPRRKPRSNIPVKPAGKARAKPKHKAQAKSTRKKSITKSASKARTTRARKRPR